MSLKCVITPLMSLPLQDRDAIATTLANQSSDLHRKLTDGRRLDERDGHIAVVYDDDRIVGWARTEPWKDGDNWLWSTLEAFVAEERRREGLALFATCGLVSTVFHHEGYGCAVFAPPMLLVASRAGLHPTLFERGDGPGVWRRATE